MTVKEFIEKSEVHIDFEICEAGTSTLLYDKDNRTLKDLLCILDEEITSFYISAGVVRLCVNPMKE